MGRTQGSTYSDTGHQGGWFWHSAVNSPVFSANLVLTRNALGDYSYNRTAAGAETYQLILSIDELKRLIEAPTAPMPFQEQFGTAAGGAGYPASVAGVPPFTGATQLVPPTGHPPKGIRITDCVAVYQVGVVNLTAASLSLNRTVYANNVANAITNVPIAATALPLVVQAAPYVVTRAVTTPVFETTDVSDIQLELSVTMANTGTLRLYGLGFHVDFNYT